VLRLVVIGAVALLGLYWLLLFLLQRSILFPRSQVGARLPRPADAKQIWLSPPASRVEAWLLPPTRASAAPSPLILYTHGNGELIDFWPQAFDEPRAWGFGVLLVEYPGYGSSAGEPSEASIREAVLAAYDWALAQPDVDRSRIIAHGRSLGGGAACLLARERPLAALILESTFTSVRAFAHRFAAPQFLVRDPFDNLAALGSFHEPTLVLHGEQDDVIPLAHGELLAQATDSAKFVRMPCGHNDCEVPWPAVHQFLVEARLLEP
jgi:fermentation-respiration switch protein FrsA (DUF1100 family)